MVHVFEITLLCVIMRVKSNAGDTKGTINAYLWL